LRQDRQDEKVSHTKPGKLRNDGFLVLGTGLLEVLGSIEFIGLLGLVEFLESRKLGREVIADRRKAGKAGMLQ
jgi:hypothetical protein